MIKYIYTILKSQNLNVTFLKWLLIIAIIYVIIVLFRHFGEKRGSQEGFTQKETFVLKQQNNIYDEFYSQIYDEIHKPTQRTDFELKSIIDMTEPTTQNSVFLDIGSGTGNIVNELNEAGYNAYGIDKSQSMIDTAEEKYPDCQYKCGDTLEPITYENSTFTHIICTYFTIYEIEDKRTFFRNCYNWLIPNGYLILHLVEPKKFDTIMPIGKSKLLVNPNRYTSSRITDTIVDFGGFEYKSLYNFNNINENKVTIKEKFKDKNTQNIRENEMILFMDNINDILNIAMEEGFSLKSKTDMKECIDDNNQFIYVLERIH